MKRNGWLTLLAAVSLVLLLVALPIMSACGAQGETPEETPGQTPATTETKYIRVGNLNSCTGTYAASGLPMRNGFDIRLTMLNESGGILVGGERYLIEPIYYDTRTDPKRGVAGILWMKDMYDIKMCVGPAESNISFATQPIFEANKIFTFTVSTANEIIRPGVQWTFAYMSMAGQRILGYVRTLKDILDVKKISMISENAAAYQSYRTDMIKYCASYGIEIINDIVFESSVTDFSTVIARARNGDPDMAVMMSTGMPGIRFLTQVHEAGWKVLIGVSPEIPTDETFRSCGPAANELICFGSAFTYYMITSGKLPQKAADQLGANIAEVKETGARYIEKYGPVGVNSLHSPSIGFASCVQMIEKADTFTDTAKMRQALIGTVVQTPFGKYKALSNQHYTAYVPVSVYYQSTTGADQFDILSYTTHTDDSQQEWVTIPVTSYEKITEIRKRRGY